jgi:hypothetical protein
VDDLTVNGVEVSGFHVIRLIEVEIRHNRA